MDQLNQVFKCAVCGHIVEIIHAGAGELVCCDQPMQAQLENSTDASTEKHVPVVEVGGSELKVKIGSVPHPMISEHYIEWIEILTDSGRVCRKYLNPGGKPEAVFCINEKVIKVREWCNVHGLWVATQ
jgi:superoxide reductase